MIVIDIEDDDKPRTPPDSITHDDILSLDNNITILFLKNP